MIPRFCRDWCCTCGRTHTGYKTSGYHDTNTTIIRNNSVLLTLWKGSMNIEKMTATPMQHHLLENGCWRECLVRFGSIGDRSIAGTIPQRWFRFLLHYNQPIPLNRVRSSQNNSIKNIHPSESSQLIWLGLITYSITPTRHTIYS